MNITNNRKWNSLSPTKANEIIVGAIEELNSRIKTLENKQSNNFIIVGII